MLQPPAERGPVAPQPRHLAKAHVAGSAVEFLAEQVGDHRIVAELDQLAAEADLEVGDAHHRRDQDYGRARFSIASSDEHALEFLAFEFMAYAAFATHDISLASSASLATVFML